MNRKQSIFKTAAHLFATQGYDATSTLQIARQVGVTEPDVFDCYDGKDTLFVAIFQEAASRYLARIESIDRSGRTAIQCLGALIRAHFSIVAEEPELMRIYLRSCPARLDYPGSSCTMTLRHTRYKLKETTEAILRKGAASGEFVKLDLEAGAKLLVALLDGLMHQQVEGTDNSNRVERAALAFCRKALVSRG
ncbi:hypothetical protein DSCA_08250 [Desulfosarcina alkanivorans]|uniref:HTH tetR-type domain-containing protein n=1 Tax=Desulfosarcina alkanivorans TaxID=571177 RepID=A0A5K7YEN4_9BACT|nr:TetR/AcrR family transcriptional regulator [Desulfosarcina alkanivorans]BBO66895.1 hypothetical protein DSCA_08250 [Desulfosarcina alkanivorans]